MGLHKGCKPNNPNGRPKNPEAEELRLALKKVKQKRGGRSFIEHFVERAYESDECAKALMKKLIADKIYVQEELVQDEPYSIVIKTVNDKTI